ncbi:MAG: hypothetical protein A2452_05110 [Candidatus Firestonebacteria bacterium RIFOXYC2_FULL_39_67]|nr:MAG: hypothetical protein A2536_10675 [Candidatus Firestonebacteria bacterium RIFOXYD2_FULL_39_29]OGF54504.1 MAG: hypothetical protein A2452_05110 [Candidatus Firestonebacteria bacterium RIFOXYC2_FULL_39_67]
MKQVIVIIVFVPLIIGCTKDFNRGNPFDPGAISIGDSGNSGGGGGGAGTTLNGQYSGTNLKLSLANSPYTVRGNVRFNDPLFIEAGTEIKYDGYYTTYFSKIVNAAGTAENPIRFIATSALPVSDDRISITNGTFNYCTFDGFSEIDIQNSNPAFTNCTFTDRFKRLVMQYVSYVSITNCNFESSSAYIWTLSSSMLTISYCNIAGYIFASGNSGQYRVSDCNFGNPPSIVNHLNNTIDAANNWWGTTDPAGISGHISGSYASNISYTPFASSFITTAGPK